MNGAESSDRAAKRVKVEEDDDEKAVKQRIPGQDTATKVDKAEGNGQVKEEVLKEEEEAEQDEGDDEYALYEAEAVEVVPPSGDLYLDTVSPRASL